MIYDMHIFTTIDTRCCEFNKKRTQQKHEKSSTCHSAHSHFTPECWHQEKHPRCFTETSSLGPVKEGHACGLHRFDAHMHRARESQLGWLATFSLHTCQQHTAWIVYFKIKESRQPTVNLTSWLSV